MAETAVKVTTEMLGDMQQAGAPEKPIYMSYDLGSLAAYADIEVDMKEAKNETTLQQIACEMVQHFTNELFSLPSEPAADTGRLISLPKPIAHLPREKPVPVEKAATKWEVFAKSKGLTKRKRQDKIWDEEKQQWLYRWGKDRANNEMDQWAIDHKDGDDLEDPWTKMRNAKKARVTKNKQQQEANIRMATTGSRKEAPNTLDLSSVVGPARAGKRNAQHKTKKGKSHLDVALSVAQLSTNSMGKFDVKRKGEPTIKAPRVKSGMTEPHNEKSTAANVLKKVLGRVKEKDSVNMDRAMASIHAMDMKKGEITTAKGIESRRNLKDKLTKVKMQAKSKKGGAKSIKGGKKGSKK